MSNQLGQELTAQKQARIAASKSKFTGEDPKASVLHGAEAVAFVEQQQGRPLSLTERRIVEEEGYSPEPYLDDRGNITQGVGATGQFRGQNFTDTVAVHENFVRDNVKNFDQLSPQTQAELTQLAYRGDLQQSPKTVSLIEQGRFVEASKELLNHKEYEGRMFGTFGRGDGVTRRLDKASAALASEGNNNNPLLAAIAESDRKYAEAYENLGSVSSPLNREVLQQEYIDKAAANNEAQESVKAFNRLVFAAKKKDAKDRINERVTDGELSTVSGNIEQAAYKGMANVGEVVKKVAQTPNNLQIDALFKRVPEEHKELFSKALFEPSTLTEAERESLDEIKLDDRIEMPIGLANDFQRTQPIKTSRDMTMRQAVEEAAVSNEFRTDVGDAIDVEIEKWRGKQNQNESRFFNADASIRYQEAIEDYDDTKPFHSEGNRKVLTKLIGEMVDLGLNNKTMMLTELAGELPEALLTTTGVGTAIAAISETARLRGEDIDEMIEEKALFSDEEFRERDVETLVNTVLTLGADKLLTKNLGFGKKGNKPDPQIEADKPTDKTSIDTSKQPFLGKTRKAAKVAASPVVESVQEGVQTNLENNTFGEDFDLAKNGEETFLSATIGMGIGGAGAAKQAAASTASALANSGREKKAENNEAKTKGTKKGFKQNSTPAQVSASKQEVEIALETGDFESFVKKSTAEVENSQEFDSKTVTGTIARRFEEQAKKATKSKNVDDAEEARETLKSLNAFHGTVADQFVELTTKMKSSNGGTPLQQKQAAHLANMLHDAEEAKKKIGRSVAKLNKVEDAITKVSESETRDEDFEINAQRILDTDTISPESITIEQMERLLKSDKWSSSERTRLINSINSKRSMDQLEKSSNTKGSRLSSSNPDAVYNDVMVGRAKGTNGEKDRGATGARSYRSQVGQALAADDIESASKARDKLAAFASNHRRKSNAINMVLGAQSRADKNGRFKVEYNEQEQEAVDYLKENHNFVVSGSNTEGIAGVIGREAEALEAVLTEVDGLIQAKRDVDPVSVKATQPKPKATKQKATTPPKTTTQPQQTTPTTNTATQATQEAPTATADASPTVTETTTPEATETVPNDTVEQPTTAATQPEAQTTPEENTQTVTEPEAAINSFNDRMNTLVNKVGSDGHRMMVQYGYLGDGTPEEKANARKSLEEYAAKSEDHAELYSLIQELESGTVSTDDNTTQEQTPNTESESEAVTDEDTTDNLADIAQQESVAKQKFDDLKRALSNQKEIEDTVIGELGLAGKKKISRKERDLINESVSERRGELLSDLRDAKAELKAIRQDKRLMEGFDSDYDAMSDVQADPYFKKRFVAGKRKSLIRAIPNIINQIRRAPSTVLAHAKELTQLTGKQKKAVQHFTNFADSFGELIDAVTPNVDTAKLKPEFNRYLPFLDGEVFSEPVKAAMSAAAYSFLASDARGTRYVQDNTIAKTLGAKSEDINASVQLALQNKGTPINLVYRQIGSQVVSAMGVKLNDEIAAGRELDALKVQMGQMIVAALSQRGLVTLKAMPMRNVYNLADAGLKIKILKSMGFTKPFSEMSEEEKTSLDKVLDNMEYQTVVATNTNASQPFDDTTLHPELQEILAVNKDTDYVIDKLFDTATKVLEPSFDPIDDVESMRMKGTLKDASQETLDMINKESKRPYEIVEDNAFIVGLLSDSDVEAVIGVVPDVISEENNKTSKDGRTTNENALSNMPKRMRDKAIAKNDGLRRELENFNRWKDKLTTKAKGLKTPFYIGLEIWNYGRFGYVNQTINPQTSKIHRALTRKASWLRPLSVNDTKNMTSFKIGVAQGLKVDIDKMTKEAILDKVEKDIFNPDSQFYQAAQAINTLKKNGESWASTEEGQAEVKKVVDAVKAGKENVHSLHSLTNLARYIEAKDNNREYFQSDAWIEIDGITNGVIIGTIIFGNGSGRDIRETLEAGGIFFNDKRDYGEHISEGNLYTDLMSGEVEKTKPNTDLYEKHAATWTARLVTNLQDALSPKKANSLASAQMIAAVKLFTGMDPTSGNVLSIARKLAKPSLMTTLYGSGFASLVRELTDNVIDNLDDMIHQTLKNADLSDEAKLQRINRILNSIRPLHTSKNGKEMPLFKNANLYHQNGYGFKSLTDVMDAEYSDWTIDNIVNPSISESLGKPMNSSIGRHYSKLIENRAIYIDNLQNLGEVFTEIFNKRANDKLTELRYLGVIGEGDPLPDKYKEELLQSLHHIMPSVQNPNGDGSDKSHLQSLSYGNESVTSQTKNGTYLLRTTTALGSGVEVEVTSPSGQVSKVKRNTLRTPQQEKTISSDVGVGPGVQNIHGVDAGTSMAIMSKFDVFNVHDGYPVSLFDLEDVGKFGNEAFINNTLSHNPYAHTIKLIENALAEIDSMVDMGLLTVPEATKLKKTLTEKKSTFKKDGTGKTKRGASDFKHLQGASLETIDRHKWLGENIEMVGQYWAPGTGFETEVGKANNEARTNGTYVEKAEPIKVSNEPAKKNTSSEQRGNEMQDKKVVPDTRPQKAATADAFGKSLEEQLEAGVPFKDALVHTIDSLGLRNVEASIAKKLLEYLPEDFSLQIINSDSPSNIIQAFDGMRGGHRVGTAEVYLKGSDFAQNGLRPETIAHELLHVVSANMIDLVLEENQKIADKSDPMTEKTRKASPNAVKAVAKLEELRLEMRSKITNSRFDEALSNVKEFVAWGMTNREFRQVLSNNYTKARRNGKLVDAFTSFADALKGFFLKGDQQKETNALKQLIELSTAVMEEDAKASPRSNSGNWNVNAQRIQELSPEEMIREFAERSGNADDAHTEHLVSLQNELVNAVAGPMGIKLKQAEEGLGDDIDQYLNHLANNTKPFVSKITNAFRLSNEEAYVAEQLEASIGSGILDNQYIRNNMLKLWESAKGALTWESFLEDPLDKDDKNEVAKAKAKYDYLFKVGDLNMGKDAFSKSIGKNLDTRKSDFLVRFAVAAAASKEVRDKINNLETTTEAPVKGNFLKRVNEGLLNLIGKIDDAVNQGIGKGGTVRRGTTVGAQHAQLLNNLARNNHRNRLKMHRLERKQFDLTQKLNKKLSDKIKSILTGKAVSQAMDSNINAVAAAAGVAYMAGSKGEDAARTITNMVRSVFGSGKDGRPSVATQLANEVIGRGHADADALTKELRLTNQAVEQTRQFGKESMIGLLRKKFGEDKKNRVSDKMNKSMHKALLSTDAGYLLKDGMTIDELANLLTNERELERAITKAENDVKNLVGNSTRYINSAKALAYYMVTNNATNRMLHKNAKQIADMTGLRVKLDKETKTRLEPAIDKLVSLQALAYSSKSARKDSAEMIRLQNKSEGENGVEFMLKQQQQLRDDSAKYNFDGDEQNMVKGYTPNTINPHITTAFAEPGSETAKRLEQQGYKFVSNVGRDKLLDNSPNMALYTIEDGGAARIVSGSMSLTQAAMMGTDVFKSSDNSEMPIDYNERKNQLDGMIGSARKDALKSLDDPNFDPREVEKTNGPMLIPTYRKDGEVKTFRYEMSEALRDSALQKRYNAIESLGTLQGGITDLSNTRDRNRSVIDTLIDQYENDPNVDQEDYVIVSPNTDSDYLKDYWNMLPYDAREYARKKFGSEGIPIKRELLHQVMGFRKLSLADKFKNPEAQQGLAKVITALTTGMFGPTGTGKLVNGIRKGEDILALMTSIFKDNVVVKNGVTTLMNLVSNFFHLLNQDMPIRQAVSGTIRGYREAGKYNKLKQRAYEVERELSITEVGTASHGKYLEELNKLKTLMASSPVHVLMEAGLFQTIVEDINNTQDPFTYKNKIAKKVDDWTSDKNLGSFNKFGKFMFATQDTGLYKMLNQPIQLSDFASRFALYEFLTETSPNKVAPADAIETVSEHFVNYDVPTSPQLQWLNDHGLMVFTKYYLRILRPVLTTFLEKPASTMLNLMAVNNFGLTSPVETVLSGNLFDRLSEPVSETFGSFDEILPVKMLTEVF